MAFIAETLTAGVNPQKWMPVTKKCEPTHNKHEDR